MSLFSLIIVVCGVFLIVRWEFVVGSFILFFFDFYVKVYRGDLFGDYYKLFVESVFRFIYSFVYLEKFEKVGDKD